MRKIAAGLLTAVILAGGFVAMALMGLLALLITDPFYPFLPVFAPLALGVMALAGYLAALVQRRLFPAHPDLKRWVKIAWAVAIIPLGLWAWGIHHVCTTPIHWQ
jgi:hypothetical protein